MNGLKCTILVEIQRNSRIFDMIFLKFKDFKDFRASQKIIPGSFIFFWKFKDNSKTILFFKDNPRNSRKSGHQIICITPIHIICMQ